MPSYVWIILKWWTGGAFLFAYLWWLFRAIERDAKEVERKEELKRMNKRRLNTFSIEERVRHDELVG